MFSYNLDDMDLLVSQIDPSSKLGLSSEKLSQYLYKFIIYTCKHTIHDRKEPYIRIL